MVLIKEIELALKPKKTEVEAVEDDLIVDSVIDLPNDGIANEEVIQEVTPGSIRKHIEADMRIAYPGKPSSRKRFFKDSKRHDKIEEESDSDDEDMTHSEDEQLTESNLKITSDDDIDSNYGQEDENDISEEDDNDISEEEDDDISKEEDDDISEEDDNDISEEEDENDFSSEEEDGSSDYGGSITGFEKELNLSDGGDDDGDKGINIFSSRTLDVNHDIQKGRSISNQLTIWEKLVECRIKLQPGLMKTNSLFQCDELKDFKSQLSKEDEETVNQTYSVLSDLMKGLLELQDMTLDASPDYKQMKNLKRKSDDDKSEEPEDKKMKNSDFLQEIHDCFKPFRDGEIQKWNDKTRLSHGKMGKGNFSSFDQPTLKQIEEILLDRERLLKRTQTNRSNCQVLGKAIKLSNEDGNDTKGKDHGEYDPEIFNDDDFYHKLLRDFIENKTSDASDISKRGKQWLELQKLRSRMKAKVDTRASKGRKLRYTVHNKMVNFMAPIPSFSWSNEAQNELFMSLFGKAIQTNR